jgi:hypothetical protein
MGQMKVRTIGFLALVLLGNARSQTLTVSSIPVAGIRPLADASVLLQEQYGKVVTYEEPILVWRDELAGDPSIKWDLSPKTRSFVMPQAGSVPDLAAMLQKTIEAYHQQISGTRFKVMTSKLGYHIVPTQFHAENGDLVPAKSVLDSQVTVPTEERTPREHLQALLSAVTSATGVDIKTGGAGDINIPFHAFPPQFKWGVSNGIARDALIDLLDRSATTFSWHLKCQPSGRPEDRYCVLNMPMLEVAVTDSQGLPAKRVLFFDRCGNCPRLPPPPPALPKEP